MSQETVPIQAAVDLPSKEETRQTKKAQVPLQELIDSLRAVQDDIGQISELVSEEKLLVAEFFVSLLRLMQPLATSLPVSASALSSEVGDVAQAYLNPTGHLAVLCRDGHEELKDLSDEKNRDLMMTVVEDVMPKFKQLTGAQRRKIENRIKFLSTVTKEMQKISKAISANMSSSSQR